MKIITISNQVTRVEMPIPINGKPVFVELLGEKQYVFGKRIIDLSLDLPCGRKAGIDTEGEAIFITGVA